MPGGAINLRACRLSGDPWFQGASASDFIWGPFSRRGATAPATNRIIAASDHAAVQINIGHLDANGVYSGEQTTLAIAGFVRGKGESDFHINRLATEAGLMKDLSSFPSEHKFTAEQQ